MAAIPLVAVMSDDYRPQLQHNESSDSNTTDDILSMVYGFVEPEEHAEGHIQYDFVTEENNLHFERRVSSHDIQGSSPNAPHILIGMLEAESLFKEARGLRYVTSKMKSSYYSSIKYENDSPVFEIWYNLRENHTIEPVHLHVNEPKHLKRRHEPVYSRYSFLTGQTTYLIVRSNPPNLSGLPAGHVPRIHPFTIHLALLAEEIETRTQDMKDRLADMLAVEARLLENPNMGELSADVLRRNVQALHKLERYFIVSVHRTGRDLSNINNLLRDLDRFARMYKAGVRSKAGYESLDMHLHDRIKDAFLSLKDACNNILRRLAWRRQRVQNFIGLLYNLTTNLDAQTNILMAREMRKDSSAMKTIAILTMLFLPATFVSSLFGTNFFALAPSPAGDGGTTFLVSEIWWVYVVTAVPLTGVVALVWLWWMRYKAHGTRTEIGEGVGQV